MELAIIFGTPNQIVEQIGPYAELGVQRILLQWMDQDDIAGLELLANQVLRQVR